MNDTSSGDRQTETEPERERERERERARARKLPRTHNCGSQYAYTLMWYHTGYQVCGPQNGEHANFYFVSDVPAWCLF